MLLRHDGAIGHAQPRFSGELAWLSLDQIIEDPRNPRRSFEGMPELIASIAAQGIVQPLLVAPPETRGTPEPPQGEGPSASLCWQIVDGEQRYRAAKRLGLASVPVIKLPPLDDAQRSALALIVNLEREALHPIDQALAFGQMLHDHHLSQRQLAEMIGWKEGRISDLLSILRIAGPILEKLRMSEVVLSRDSLERIGHVADPVEQQRLGEMLLKDASNLEIRRAIAAIGKKPSAMVHKIPFLASNGCKASVERRAKEFPTDMAIQAVEEFLVHLKATARAEDLARQALEKPEIPETPPPRLKAKRKIVPTAQVEPKLGVISLVKATKMEISP